MKCQILFSGKTKKNNIILPSAENAQRVVKVNVHGLSIIGSASLIFFSVFFVYKALSFFSEFVFEN